MKISWTSKWIIFALVLLTAFLAQQKYRQYLLQAKIEKEKVSLQKELQGLEGRNSELQRTLGYLDSDTYRELIAKQQLNLQKNGELAYSFSENQAPPDTGNAKQNASEQSNFQKWANYFLNKSKE